VVSRAIEKPIGVHAEYAPQRTGNNRRSAALDDALAGAEKGYESLRAPGDFEPR
jgi:hypothetical protein